MGNIWRSRRVSLNLKLRVLWATAFPIAIYGSESWTMQKADERWVDSFEMWCYRRVLRIPWTLTERKTNSMVRRPKVAFLWTCNSKEGTRHKKRSSQGRSTEREREAVPQHHGSRTSRALQGWHCKMLWEQHIDRERWRRIVKTTASHNATSDWRERERVINILKACFVTICTIQHLLRCFHIYVRSFCFSWSVDSTRDITVFNVFWFFFSSVD